MLTDRFFYSGTSGSTTPCSGSSAVLVIRRCADARVRHLLNVFASLSSLSGASPSLRITSPCGRQRRRTAPSCAGFHPPRANPCSVPARHVGARVNFTPSAFSTLRRHLRLNRQRSALHLLVATIVCTPPGRALLSVAHQARRPHCHVSLALRQSEDQSTRSRSVSLRTSSSSAASNSSTHPR